MSLEHLTKGHVTNRDAFLWTFVLIVIGIVLIVMNTVSNSTWSSVYSFIFVFAFIVWLAYNMIAKVASLKILPIAAIGLGDLSGRNSTLNVENWIVFTGLGVVFGLLLVMGIFFPTLQVAFQIATPALGVADPIQNVFLSGLVVPIVEESTTAMLFLPTMANVLLAGGVSVLFVVSGIFSFFFAAGYNILATLVFLLLAFIFQRVPNFFRGQIIAIAVVAVLADAAYFTTLHGNVYGKQVGNLAFTFIYRIIADVLVIVTGSIVPSLLSHSINNSVAVGIASGVPPIITIAPPLILIGLVYLIRSVNIEKSVI